MDIVCVDGHGHNIYNSVLVILFSLKTWRNARSQDLIKITIHFRTTILNLNLNRNKSVFISGNLFITIDFYLASERLKVQLFLMFWCNLYITMDFLLLLNYLERPKLQRNIFHFSLLLLFWNCYSWCYDRQLLRKL